jgi:hypothetical protein
MKTSKRNWTAFVVVPVSFALLSCAHKEGGSPSDDKPAPRQLISAVIAGRGDEARRLASGRINSPDPSDARGRTPLMYAIEWKRVDLVKGLLALGADPSRADGNGLTGNDYAAGSGDGTIKQSLSATNDSSGGTQAPEKPLKSGAKDAAWAKLNALDLDSIEAYLRSSGQPSANRSKAIGYYMMQLRIADVRQNAYPGEEFIGDSLLGKAWADDTDKEVAAGGLWLSPDLSSNGVLGLLEGGATHRATIYGNTNLGMGDGMGDAHLSLSDLVGPEWKQLAASGKPLKFSVWPHTGDGSVMGYDTGGHDVATYDWIVRSSNGPLVFGVVKKVGIVHLAGAGSLKLATGKVFEFK